MMKQSIIIDSSNKKNRVQIIEKDNKVKYFVPAWPGWGDILNSLFGLLIVSIFLALILCFLYLIPYIIGVFFEAPIFGDIFSFFFSVNFIFLVTLTLLVFWIPLFIIHQISSKEFWFEEDNVLYQTKLFGFITRKRSIKTNKINTVKIIESGSMFNIRLVLDWVIPLPLTLVNAIPSREEAESICALFKK